MTQKSESINEIKKESTKKENKPAFKSYTAKVTAAILNVRKGPGFKFDIVKTMAKDTKCIITSEKTKENSKWGKLPNDEGWVNLDYIIEI